MDISCFNFFKSRQHQKQNTKRKDKNKEKNKDTLPERSWGEVVKKIGECRRKGTVVLRSHNHKPLTFLDNLVGVHHPLRSLTLILHEVERLCKERSADFKRVEQGGFGAVLLQLLCDHPGNSQSHPPLANTSEHYTYVC